MTEEKRNRIVAATTVAATLLIVILVAVVIYQMVIMISIATHKKEIKKNIADYTERANDLERDLEERLYEDWYLEEEALKAGWHRP